MLCSNETASALAAQKGSLDEQKTSAAAVIPGVVFNDVRERSWSWIWTKSSAFQKFRGELWMEEPCRGCERRAEDFGVAVARLSYLPEMPPRPSRFVRYHRDTKPCCRRLAWLRPKLLLLEL